MKIMVLATFLLSSSMMSQQMRFIGFGIGHASSEPRDNLGTGIGHAYKLFNSDKGGLSFEYPAHWNAIEILNGAIFGELGTSMNLPIRAQIEYDLRIDVRSRHELLQHVKSLDYVSSKDTMVDGHEAVIALGDSRIDLFVLRSSGKVIRVSYGTGERTDVIEENFKRLMESLVIDTL